MTSMDHFFGEANVDLVTSWQACPAIRRESKVAAGGGRAVATGNRVHS